MSWSPWASCLLSAVLGLSACKRAPAWQVLGETARAPSGSALNERSPLFDGQRVHLRAARGETLGVFWRSQDGRARRVTLELPDNAARLQAFAVRSLEVRERSSDMYGPSTGRGLYPDVLVPEGETRAATERYFDVRVPSEAEPGKYRGVLRVDARPVPVELEVSPVVIELEHQRQPWVWAFYAPREVARVHGLPEDDGPRLLAKEAEYAEMFRAHGVLLASDLGPQRFEARRALVHDALYWPVAIDTTSDETVASDVARWLELFKDSDVTPFAIPVDEPRTPAARAHARHIAEVMRRAGAGRPRLLCAVTDAWSPVYGDVFDVYFSPANFPEPAQSRRARGERYWTYNGKPPGAGSMILDTDGTALRTWGWIGERYQIDLWYAWEALYFSDRYNHGGPTDVLRDPLTFDERTHGGSDYGNGDGVLAYPGPLPSLRLKALRRGLQDRLLLKKLESCGGGDVARRLVARVVPRALGEAGKQRSWSLDEPTWERFRLELLDATEKECHAQASLAH